MTEAHIKKLPQRLILPYEVQRLDENPANTATYRTWCHVCSFPTLETAQDFVYRAQGPSQKLRAQRKSETTRILKETK
jgi:hypothetical protein